MIVGDGPQRATLEEALPDAVFTGFLGGEELARAVASFDLFVHPGEFETFCQTIQEAMASGVPVVATGRGGPLDLVENSRTGWLYQPGDLAGLRAHVMDLIGDDAKRRAFAAAAHASVQDRTWPALSAELVRHYRSVITGLPVAEPADNRHPAVSLRNQERSNPVRISVIGCGYLGAVHAATLASMGHTVVGIDVDAAKVDHLGRGHAPFFEPGLDELLRDGRPPAGSRSPRTSPTPHAPRSTSCAWGRRSPKRPTAPTSPSWCPPPRRCSRTWRGAPSSSVNPRCP